MPRVAFGRLHASRQIHNAVLKLERRPADLSETDTHQNLIIVANLSSITHPDFDNGQKITALLEAFIRKTL